LAIPAPSHAVVGLLRRDKVDKWERGRKGNRKEDGEEKSGIEKPATYR
jgi:hypothetical protein